MSWECALTVLQEYGECMADMPSGMKINFDEQNMTKWEVLMDGPEQSVYAVCTSASRALLQYPAELTLHRAGTSSSRSHSPTSTPSNRRWFPSALRSTTPMSATTTRAPCAWVCCVPTSGSHRTRLFRSFASFRRSSSNQTRTTLSSRLLRTNTGRTARILRRMRRTGLSATRSDRNVTRQRRLGLPGATTPYPIYCV